MADTAQLEQLSTFCMSLPHSVPGDNGSTSSIKPEPPAPPPTANENASLAATPIPVVESNQSAGGGCTPPPKSDRLSQLEQILDARKIDLANPPPPPVPIFKLGRHQICTEGNITGLSSQAKAGKSAVVGAMIASALSDDPNNDTFGFSSPVQRSGAIIHFDCEQSPHDATEGLRKILHRAGVTPQPCRLLSYFLADVPTTTRRELLNADLSRAAKSFGDIHSVFIDGVADLCVDPNDSAEAFQLIEELHGLAIQFKTSIILVLHENPGGLGGGKTRGHLGSQLERKAESNLRLSKSNEEGTEIYGERCRHAHIPKGTGPCFKWDVEAGMHVSCESAKERRGNGRVQELNELVESVFRKNSIWSYTDLKNEIANSKGVQPKSAENWVKKLTNASLIQKDGQGRYTKNP